MTVSNILIFRFSQAQRTFRSLDKRATY
jgi:hypothetical protein